MKKSYRKNQNKHIQSGKINKQSDCISMFYAYLHEELSLVPKTITLYTHFARRFLLWRFKTKALCLNKINPKDVLKFFGLCSPSLGKYSVN